MAGRGEEDLVSRDALPGGSRSSWEHVLGQLVSVIVEELVEQMG